MEETNKTIGSNIRALRLKADLTQTELSVKLECSRETIVSYENNRVVPSIEMLLNICKALKCSPNMILKGFY